MPVNEQSTNGNQSEKPDEDKQGDNEGNNYLMDSDNEDEDQDRSIEMEFNYALGSLLSNQYETQLETAFQKDSLQREMADELMDMIGSEFFAGALYELCTATFKSIVLTFLADRLH